jgi:transaldolase
MKDNPLLNLEALGQSVWLDFISRGSLTSGQLKRLIEEDGLSGVTSNPSIFEKSILLSQDYEQSIHSLVQAGKSAEEIYQQMTVTDIRMAADLFRPTFDRTDGRDGFVSIEVSPHLAHDTAGSLAEARRLWAAVNRPNVMIKIPGTPEGLPAIQALIQTGININITLLFGLTRYQQVVEAYLSGLEARSTQGGSLGRVASVASFFLSRIDVLIDPMLEEKMKMNTPQAGIASELHGQIEIQSAKAAYGIFNELFHGPRFQRLLQQGARPQRLLWASTSTKNPSYSDVKYVEPLIGSQTINTLPLETLEAYRDHGKPAAHLAEGLNLARLSLERLSQVQIELEAVTAQLEKEGVEKFNQAYDKTLATLQEKQAAALKEPQKG